MEVYIFDVELGLQFQRAFEKYKEFDPQFTVELEKEEDESQGGFHVMVTRRMQKE